MKAKEETSFNDGPNMLTRVDTLLNKHIGTPPYVRELTERPEKSALRVGGTSMYNLRLRSRLGAGEARSVPWVGEPEHTIQLTTRVAE